MQYVCLCYDITRSNVKNAIKEGHDSMEKLEEHLKVGTHCGGCTECVEKILEKSQKKIF